MRLPLTYGRTVDVRPGIIDREAIFAYKAGQCHALAMTLHDLHGWPMFMIDNDHLVVRLPEGQYLDIAGVHDFRVGFNCSSKASISMQTMRKLIAAGIYLQPDLVTAEIFANAVVETYMVYS